MKENTKILCDFEKHDENSVARCVEQKVREKPKNKPSKDEL